MYRIADIVAAGYWVIVQPAIVLLALIAARRHKMRGLWVLAAAAVLSAVDCLMHVLFSSDFLARHENTTVYLILLHYFSYVVWTTALSGWAVLAFSRKKEGPNG